MVALAIKDVKQELLHRLNSDLKFIVVFKIQ